MSKTKSDSGAGQSRRKFILNSGIGAVSLAGLPIVLSSFKGRAESIDRKKKANEPAFKIISQGDIILFQGDSITDAGREKKKELPNNARSFGTGYANIIAAELLHDLADKDLTIYNRGISGNKVFQLDERWQRDCLELKPDLLSILIGVNDFWHMRNGEYEGTPEIYENDYRSLLNRTLLELPDIQLVLCEPFILSGTSAVDDSWIKPFSEYQEIAAKLAKDFDTIWVPFQSAFNKATQAAPATHWAADGVHPSMAGCELMAETWLKAIQKG